MRRVYLEKPAQFNPKFEVVSCFVRHGDQFLFLHRQEHKPDGNMWGRPAGKMDPGENVLDATCRELLEETGIIIQKDILRNPLHVYVRHRDKDFVYHIAEAILENTCKAILNSDEHSAYEWIGLKEAITRDLVPGEKECIKYYYKLK